VDKSFDLMQLAYFARERVREHFDTSEPTLASVTEFEIKLISFKQVKKILIML